MNDGHEPEQPRVKKCPFLNDWCIGDACSLHAQIIENIAGVPQKQTTCIFNALGIILSQINAKTQLPQPKIKLPANFLRG